MDQVQRSIDDLRSLLRGWGHGPEARATRGFTLPEMLVSVSVFGALVLIVASVFSNASNATGRTIAHAEMLDASATVESTLRSDFVSTVPGFMLIYSPNVTDAGADPQFPGTIDDMPDIAPNAPSGQGMSNLAPAQQRVTRSDMLSFISGDREHQSWWLTQNGEMLTRPDAILTLGHGVTPQDGLLPDDAAYSWNLCRRAILLGVPLAPAIVPFPQPDGGDVDPVLYNIDTLQSDLREARVDAVQTSTLQLLSVLQPALREVFENGQDPRQWLGSFLTRSEVPGSIVDPDSSDGIGPDYFRQHCFRFMPRTGQVIVEWTDGSVVNPTLYKNFGPNSPDLPVPYDSALQWFGRPRDANGDGDVPGNIGTPSLNVNELDDPGDVMTQWQYADRWFTQSFDHDVDVVDSDNNYYAGWRHETWGLRPKAIRVIVRFFDQNVRISNIEPWPPQPANPADQILEKRFGLEFSIVVAVP